MAECQIVNSTYVCFESNSWNWVRPDVIGLVVGVVALGVAVTIFFYQRRMDKDVHGFVSEQKKIQDSIRNAAFHNITYYLMNAFDDIRYLKDFTQEPYPNSDDLGRLNQEIQNISLAFSATKIKQQSTLLTPYISAEFRAELETVASNIEDISKPDELLPPSDDPELDENDPARFPDVFQVINAWNATADNTMAKIKLLIERIEKKQY